MRSFKFISALLIATNALLVSSKVTFKVIAISGTPSVVISSKKYVMNVEEYPVYSVTINDVYAPVKYHYIIGKEEEKFTRIVDSDSTLNEFFNREVTVKKHPLLPKAFETLSTLKKSKLFDDTHIDTIVLQGKKNDFDKLNANPSSDKKIDVKVIFVSPYTVKVFQNGAIKISGQSTKYNKKLSYRLSGLKTDDDKELFGRTAVKLRSEYGDASFMREKTYFDILNAIGVPTSQSKFVRVFLNETPAGLFLMTDDFSNKSFLKSTFNNGKKFDVDNAVFKVNSGGDLSYKSFTVNGSEPYSYKGDIKNADNKKMINEILVPFMKEVDKYPETKKISLDVQAFLKNMAMEYLAYGTDNYWMVQGNYFIFKNMAANKWFFIDSDFDMTFGVSNPEKCVNTSLDDYVLIKNKGSSRPLIDNLRKNSSNDRYLREAVEKIVKSTFNIDALGPRLDSFAELI
jgi:spore coat protein CotH